MRTRVSNSRRALRHATAIAAALFISATSDAQEKTTEPARDGGSSAAPSNAATPAVPSVVKGMESGSPGPKGETGAHSEATTKMERRKQEEQGKAKLGPKGESGAHSEATTKMERRKQEEQGKAKLGPKGDYGAHNVASSKAQQMKPMPTKPMPEPKSPKL